MSCVFPELLILTISTPADAAPLHEAPQAHISVVIPALNEAHTLPANLRRLLADPYVAEIIVVDGGSTDNTRQVVQEFADVKLLDSEPGRGLQMNVGAQQASGRWLLFHHADSLLADSAGAAIAALDQQQVFWGGFTHSFIPGNWKLWCVSALHNFRCRRTGVVYGDQSMFVQRDFFWQLGGFPQTPLEDLAFSDYALLHEGSVLLPDRVATDSRKFTQLGELRGLMHVISILRRYQQSRAIDNEVFFRDYR